MITLVLSADGTPTVWNPVDWLTLRGEHRIVGSLIGALGHLPHQDIFKGLPFALLPEEATFLIERKIARLSVFPSLKCAPQETVKEAFHKHLETTYNEQVENMRNERKRQLESVMDRIVEGRRKKLLGMATKKQKKGKVKKEEDVTEESCVKDEDSKSAETAENENNVVIDRDVVLQEEMAKIPPLSQDHTLVQTFTAFPWLREDDACPAKWNFPKSKHEILRYEVFKDLLEQGYFISTGHKFGGDFLVYPGIHGKLHKKITEPKIFVRGLMLGILSQLPSEMVAEYLESKSPQFHGDPMKYHSHYIVMCVEQNYKINAFQLVSNIRVATAVKKGFVLATVKRGSNKPSYQTVYWATNLGECPV